MTDAAARTPMASWTPQDIDRITADVGAITQLQRQLLEHASAALKVADRVAHQFQIAGSRVSLRIAPQLPSGLDGVGLFEANAEYTGIGRVSTGLGCPHAETSPDFLGLRLAFRTKDGRRVDFIGINHPAAPTDTHIEFMALLAATVDAAGHGAVLSEAELAAGLLRELGVLGGTKTVGHVARQTARTALSSTAYQSYWTGVVEAEGTPGKCVMAPVEDVNTLRSLAASPHYLTEDWRERQSTGALEFDLFWIPFIDEERTPLLELTRPWEENRTLLGRVTFPKTDFRSEQAILWAALAAEMGANPGNWVPNHASGDALPATAFGLARKIAYALSQQGRDALPEDEYAGVLSDGVIGDELAAELTRRRELKQRLGHVDGGPG